MRRTNISLTEEQYEKVKKGAFDGGISISAIIRALIQFDNEVIPKKSSETTMNKEKIRKEVIPIIRENKRLEEKYNPAPKPKKK